MLIIQNWIKVMINIWIIFWTEILMLLGANPQEKKTRSTVLNPRRAKFYDFQVLTGALHTVYHESSLFFKNIPGNFFQRDTSSESNCNRSFRG